MSPLFPDAAFRATRTAQKDLALVLLEGVIPVGLTGHLYILSPVGSVDSGGVPYPDGNDRPTVVNGDGMVWRIDFGRSDQPTTATSQIVRPPDYYWDELTKTGSPLDFAGFVDMGMLRASLFLGTRNFANTAFVPMAPPPGTSGPTRMICAYDAGPPVEIDPASLETLGVVGSSWDPEALDGLVAFPPILATAHPFYDAHTGELFAVNYGRSGLSMIETIPLFEALAFLPEAVQNVIGRIAAALGKTPLWPTRLGKVSRALGWAIQAGTGALKPKAPTRKVDIDLDLDLDVDLEASPEGLIPENFLDIVWWSGEGDIVRLPVVDVETGAKAVVEQSMHQVAVTRRFVLMLDTNFKLRFDQFYNNPFPYVPEVERLLRAALASQQGAHSNLWIVRRDAVDKARQGEYRSVPGIKVRLPGAVHFLADYDDSDGIRIQCAHGTALDIAEWVRQDDLKLDGQTVREPLHGMIASQVDVSRLGQYVIDPERRRIVESRILSDDRLWGIGLYAANGVPAWGDPPERLDHVFWFSSGLWGDNYTLFIRALYADYPGRQVPLAEVDRLVARGGIPSMLLCIDSDRFTICDSYAFPEGTSLSSPQFVPDGLAPASSRAGFITTVVWDAASTFLWVFDARDLARGPITRLEVPAELGFSLHSAWLPEAASTSASSSVARGGTPEATWRETLLTRIASLSAKSQKRLEPLIAALTSGRGVT